MLIAETLGLLSKQTVLLYTGENKTSILIKQAFDTLPYVTGVTQP